MKYSSSTKCKEYCDIYRNNRHSEMALIPACTSPEKPLINFANVIVWFNQHGLSGTLPQALIIICEECSLFSCQL